MKLRNIIFLSAMLIITSFVISPLTASAAKTAYGNCKTSKWGVTVRADFTVHYVRIQGSNQNFVYRWAARVRAWGKGAKIQNRANVTLGSWLGSWRSRMYVYPNKGSRAKEATYYIPKGSVVEGGMGINLFRGRSTKRERCYTWIGTAN